MINDLDVHTRNILDACLFGVSIADMNGQLVYGNQALLDLFKTDSRHFIGRRASEFYLKSEQREEIVSELKTKGFIKAVSIELIRDDQSTFWATLSFKKSIFAGENAYFCWFYDLTDRLDMERKLKEQTKLALHSGKLASLGEMAAGVGHEINNPLSIVSGMLSLIKKEAETVQHRRILDHLAKGRKAVTRIKNIVSGISNLARIDGEVKEVFSLTEVIDETTELLEEIYRNFQIEIKRSYQNKDALLIEGNRGRFQQVIMNLLVNAKDALESAETKRVSVNASAKNGRVFLKVHDSGKGILKENLDKVFEPFFTTKGVNKGTGIGLAMSFSIIKEHLGTVSVSSAAGEGTTFSIEVPQCH